MTDEEFNELEKKRRAFDKEFFSVVKKFDHHPAVHHGMKSPALCRIIYTIIFSGKPDEEIIKELDKIAPSGGCYL